MAKPTLDSAVKKEISRLRSEVRDIKQQKSNKLMATNVAQNYWTQTGMPWASSEGRKAVLTEYFWQPIRGQPRRVDTNELRQFAQTFWVSSCVKTIMDEIASLDWDIVPQEDYEYDWVADAIKEIKQFLKYPNRNNEPFNNIIRALIKDVLEIDAGVIVKVFSVESYDFDNIEPKSGAPMLKPFGQRKMTELYVRDGASFLKEIDKFGFCKGFWQYSYQIPAHPMWFNREEIVYISEHNRSMSCYGYARTQAILDIIKSLHYSTLYNKRFFEESAIPDGAISLLDTDEAEMNNFMTYWNNEFKAQPHKLAIANKDIKFTPFSMKNTELEFLQTQKWYYNIVISMFGLTPSEMGITEDVNRATSATQSELVKRKGIRPFLKLFESYINDGIIKEFGHEGVEFQFIYDDPAEKNARLTNWQMELQMGVKTPNEVRLEMGLQPIDGGDTPMTQQGANFYTSPESPQGAQGKEESDAESGNYKEERDRQEAKPKNKDGEKVKETERQVKAAVKNPFGPDTRLMDGKSFKKSSNVTTEVDGEKVNMVVFSQEEIVDEHEKLVKILESGTEEEKKKLLEEQKKELENYKHGFKKALNPDMGKPGMGHSDKWWEMYHALRREGHSEESAAKITNSRIHKGFVAPVGQFYNEQPITQANRLNGAMFQPQNTEPDTNPSQLGSDIRVPERDTYEAESKVVCPMCHHATLAELNSLENDMPDDIRCTSCGARFRAQDLMDAKIMEEVSNALIANNMTTPLAPPAFKPKSCDCDFHKGIKDDDLDVKSFAGFDTEKSLPFSRDYVNSGHYEKLLKGYLSDLKKSDVEKILRILKSSLKSDLRISEIAKRIESVVDDSERAKLIARTEVIRISNEGNLERMQKEGVSKAKFLSAPEDGRLCEICKGLDQKVLSLKNAKGLIPVHPRCRCTFTEIYD